MQASLFSGIKFFLSLIKIRFYNIECLRAFYPVPCLMPPCLISHSFITDLPDSGMLYFAKYRQNLPFIDSLYFLIDLKKSTSEEMLFLFSEMAFR